MDEATATAKDAAYVLVAGPNAAAVFRLDGDRLDPRGVPLPGPGRIPSPAELEPALARLGLAGDSRPALIVTGAAAPRVTVDGRSSLNPLALRVTATAALQAGATLAGPSPSDAVAVELFLHELARQTPDALVLTQPVAGDKLRLLVRYLRLASFEAGPFPVVYNGPAAYAPKVLGDHKGCRYEQVSPAAVGGRAAPEATRAALAGLVERHLAQAVAASGHPGVPFVSLGATAALASRRLSDLADQTGEAAGGEGGRADRTARPAWARPAASLIVAEPEEVVAFVTLAGEVDAASVSLTRTGSVDLVNPGRVRPGEMGTEGWLPAWDSLARRLPLDLEEVDVGNLTGDTLVRPTEPPAGPAEASVRAALVEELLARLRSRWPDVARKESNPGLAHLVVGTGFGFAWLGDVGYAAGCLVNGLEPTGVTTIAIDPWGALLAGVAAGRPASPEVVCVVVSPLKAGLTRQKNETDPWAIVTVETEDGRSVVRRLVPGRVTTIPLGPGEKGRLTIEPCFPKLDFGAGPGRVWRGVVSGGVSGVLLDGRGRPLARPAEAGLRVTKNREFLAALGVLDRTRGRGRGPVVPAAVGPSAAEPPQAGRFRLIRRLPAGCVPRVKRGERVSAATVIAAGHLDRHVLRLPPGGNFELLKKPGDPVKKGEAVAVQEEMFGFALREFVSPYDGVVESVNSRRTALVLTSPGSEILALLPGTVEHTSADEVVLTGAGHRFVGWFGLGRPAGGSLLWAGELFTDSEVRRALSPEVRGRVVVAESYVLPGVLPALSRLGAAALVCGGLDFGPLWDLVAPGGPFPAGRGLPTLVVLEGFGSRRMKPETRDILKAAEGRDVYVAGPAAGRLVFAGPPHAEVIVAGQV